MADERRQAYENLQEERYRLQREMAEAEDDDIRRNYARILAPIVSQMEEGVSEQDYYAYLADTFDFRP